MGRKGKIEAKLGKIGEKIKFIRPTRTYCGRLEKGSYFTYTYIFVSKFVFNQNIISQVWADFKHHTKKKIAKHRQYSRYKIYGRPNRDIKFTEIEEKVVAILDLYCSVDDSPTFTIIDSNSLTSPKPSSSSSIKNEKDIHEHIEHEESMTRDSISNKDTDFETVMMIKYENEESEDVGDNFDNYNNEDSDNNADDGDLLATPQTFTNKKRKHEDMGDDGISNAVEKNLNEENLKILKEIRDIQKERLINEQNYYQDILKYKYEKLEMLKQSNKIKERKLDMANS